MIQALPKQMLLAIVLTLGFLLWSFGRWRAERAAFLDSSASLQFCRSTLAKIRELPDPAADNSLASEGYQPEADVVAAASSARIPMDGQFGVSHLAPMPIEGTNLAQVVVDVQPMALALKEVIAFLVELDNLPVQMNVRRLSLTRAPATADDGSTEVEKWTASFDIYYLTQSSEASTGR